MNTDYAEVLPMGRFTPLPLSLPLQSLLIKRPAKMGQLAGGRVDMTNGERRHVLVRSIEDGQDRWYALKMDQAMPVEFDRTCFEAILEDLLK